MFSGYIDLIVIISPEFRKKTKMFKVKQFTIDRDIA